RKARGISIGMPPSRTVRGKEGYLQPSPEGARLLSDGTSVAGTPEEAPEDGALWRGFHEAAERIRNLYAAGNLGLETVAYKRKEGGWAYRDRTGAPREITRDDVRRVVANWPEYGGIVMDHKAKDRRAYDGFDNVDEIPFQAERAIFPVKLLR